MFSLRQNFFMRRAQIGKVGNYWMNNARRFSTNESTHDDFKANNKQTLEDYEATKEYFDKTLKENSVVLFMKGNPSMPQCGFSNYVIQIFKFYGLKNFHSINVLDSAEVREGIKKYSNWPTIPQLYVKEEFVGGCDIVKEMHMDGSLEDLLQKEGLIKK
mmetsp:Transcript_30697/g.27154  ORF Transcript_30697/g.27154 Transcript_30697/m.27154 type:complete len:159 (-) Transcript_30697:27-503(-)